MIRRCAPHRASVTSYEAARKGAFEERRTLGKVVNDLIARRLEAGPPESTRRLGAFAGQITIADDFDAPLGEIEEYLDRPVDP